MTQDATLNRIVRTWLDEGADSLPDHVLSDVLTQIPTLKQRRPLVERWQPRTGGVAFRLAAAAMAVVVVAATALVISTFRPSGLIGNPPSPSPTARWYVPPMPGELPAGTVTIYDPFPMQVQLDLGPGWTLSDDGVGSDAAVIYKGSRFGTDGRGLIIAVPTMLYNDACDTSSGIHDPGPSATDFMNALTTQQPGPAATGVGDVQVGGFDGKHVQVRTLNLISHEIPPACSGGIVRWVSSQSLPHVASGQSDEYWVLDVDGRHLVLDAFDFGAHQADLDELRQAVQGMRIKPATMTDVYVPPMPGPLPPGKLVIDYPFPIRLEAALPDGFSLGPGGVGTDTVMLFRGSLDSPGGYGAVFATPSQLYNDPCDPSRGTVNPGPTVDDFVHQILDVQRHGDLLVEAIPTQLSGYSGTRFVMQTVAYKPPSKLACQGDVKRWVSTQVLPTSQEGQTDAFWVLDVAGTRLVIDAFQLGPDVPDPNADVGQIGESLKINP